MNEDNNKLKEEIPLILIVEDDVDFLAFMESDFSESYQVITGTHGQEGLSLAREHLPDLVVTDLMMPIMGGVELCRQLKEDEATSHIPVIILTAKSSLESQLTGLQTGADDYVTKPFVIELLMARVANLLKSRKELRERFSREFKTPGRPKLEFSLDQEFLQKAFNVLEDHASNEQFSADAFARKMNISLRTLHRKLKALTNDTPSKLIWNLRLKQAASLLVSSDLRITEIAFAVGFADSAHFSRMFRQHYSLSPSDYRVREKK